MKITFANQNSIDDMYFHDGKFEGLDYDYTNKSVKFKCVQGWLKKEFSFCFCQVVLIYMQSCCFWGRGNAIYDIWIDKDPTLFQHLLDMQKENPNQYEFSLLDTETPYISVVIQLNSGDELRITCKSIEITEIDRS